MSFILEALKKSENKRRRQNGQISRTIHEPLPRKNPKSRSWLLGIWLFLLINAVLLLWFFVFSTQPDLSIVNADSAAAPSQSASSQPHFSATRNHPVTLPDVTQPPQQDEQKPVVVKALPVPRNDQQVYSFGQLPVSIQKQIPALKMSLHAYNRNDGSASLVQLNDRIMREGDRVADSLELEKIEADGIVLRYDGYRFLLPRRGN